MTTTLLFVLVLIVGALFFSGAIGLAKIPSQRKIGTPDELIALKRFHDDRAFEVFKLFVQVLLAFGAGLGFIALNQKSLPPEMAEAAQWIVAASGYLLAVVVTIHKCSKVWASGQNYWISVLSSELFTVPGMIAITSVVAFRLVPAVFGR